MSFCIKCGKQNPDTAKFCTACGGTLTATTVVAVQRKKKSQWLAISVIVLVGLLVVSYFIFFNNPKKQGKVSINDDTKTSIKELVNQWNSAINSGNASSVSALYAENLVYYRQSVSKSDAEMTLYDFFQKNPNFSQQITGEITVEKNSDNLIVSHFDKTVSLNGKTTVYPSYLKFSKENDTWKIVEEGDKITDYNINKNK